MSASRKLGEHDASELVRQATTIFVAKGKKLEVLEGGTVSQEIVAKLLGSTGNLRAPLIKVGTQLLVGFHEETYDQVLSQS